MKSLFYPSKTVGTLACLALLFCGYPSAATDQYIYIQSDGFDPSSVQIQTGDTVYWLNLDDGITHSTASDIGAWNSGAIQPYDQYVENFPFAGTYPYHDAYSSFTGSITVTSPPPPAPMLLKPTRTVNGLFQFTITNLVQGRTNFVQASSNLLTWTNIYTNIAIGSSYVYTDNAASGFRFRYYRAAARP